MTVESDIARMERLLAKATRGPWKADKNEGCKKIKGAKLGTHRQAQHVEVAYTVGLADEKQDRANAELIALVVSRLPGLLVLARRGLTEMRRTR